MHGVQVLNTQRDRIYSERRKALLAEDLAAVMVEYSEETMNDILEARPSRLLSASRLASPRGHARPESRCTLHPRGG